MSQDLRIAVIPGDGIGVEVTAEAVRALEAVASASGARSTSSTSSGARITI
jgi:isocitrate/isopropylmalate dehydrogenase